MRMVGAFWSWLTASTRGSLDKGHPDLNPLDVDQLAKDLRLAEEGKRLGEAGLPASDAKALSGPEAAAVQRVEKARQDYVDWAVLRVSVLSRDIGKRNVTQSVNHALQADKEFERRASGLLSEQEGALRSLGDTARTLKGELEAFRTKHALVRESDYPETTGKFAHIAVLLVLIVFEGAFNATFFAQGLTSGLIGGFAWAGILAALNVVVAFSFGLGGVRYLNHRKVGWKLVGLISLFAALAAMVAIGLGIAHYRDSLTSEAADAATAAYQAYTASPFHLADLSSWALLGISIVFGVIALFDGLSFEDRYPGYGAISRRTEEAIDDHEDAVVEVRKQLEELKEEELKSLAQALQESQAAVAVFESLIDDKRSASSRLTNALRNADNSLDALLKMFRTENQLHRAGVRRPDYFDLTPVLRDLKIPDFATATDENALAEQRELVTTLLAEVQQVRASIQASFSQQFDRLKPLGTHFPRKGDA
jgi:hypothetical protein